MSDRRHRLVPASEPDADPACRLTREEGHRRQTDTDSLFARLAEQRQTAEFEAELLEKVNALGLGPQAVGGRNTALAVHIEAFPTHIAALPVAVNLQCHSARLKEAVL